MFVIHKWLSKAVSLGGVTVSMVAFQAVDPGLIPGRRILRTFSYPYTNMFPLYARRYNHI